MDEPGDEPPDALSYDPHSPDLPGSIGLRSLAIGANNPGSDQQHDEAPGLVLTYTTPVLKDDVEVTGPITVELYASGTAVDQDWVAHLTRVHPDGKSWLTTGGMLKASHRASHSDPGPITPGEVYKLEIEVWATSQLFRKGERIRLDLMNATFPKVEPCPYPSTNEVFPDRERPSCIVLPIIPRDGGGVWMD
ncbi:MAG: CocE/NonD family hydrolase [Tepidiformaceae bacterium]